MYVMESKMFLGVMCAGDFLEETTAVPSVHWYSVYLALGNSSAAVKLCIHTTGYSIGTGWPTKCRNGLANLRLLGHVTTQYQILISGTARARMHTHTRTHTHTHFYKNNFSKLSAWFINYKMYVY